MKRRIAIVGGGVAGIAAALRVADAGDTAILIETRKRLGGRATSFVDPRTGELLDNCQHVVMGCCTNLLDLYDRLGVLDEIVWHRTYYWTDGGGRIDRMEAGRLPAPLHLLGAMRRMTVLGRDERRAIARCMWRIVRLGGGGRQRWAGRTFSEFLLEHGQPQRAVDRFWNVVIVSACNLDVSRVDAATALHVFQEGFLASKWSYAMGLSSAPLLDLYDAAEPIIAEHGGELRLSTSARSISFDGRRVTGVVTADDVIDASAVIAAVPPDRLAKLVSEPLRKADARLQSLAQFAFSPILGVHLKYTSAVMDLPHLTLIGAPGGTQWLFNKYYAYAENDVQHVHAVISAADGWMELSEEEIVERVADDVNWALPESVGLRPVGARAVKERRATFAATPGVERMRPPSAPGYVGLGGGGVENLYLAGDWCETGWPATMEGAARSGYAAAAAATGEGELVEDVPPGLLARMLGLKNVGAQG